MSSPLLRRRAAAAAVSALLVTGLAACGGSDGGSPFADGGTSAPTTTATDDTAGTSPAAPVTTDGGQAAGSTVSSDEMSGILKESVTSIDTAHMSVTSEFSLGGQSTQLTVDGDLRMDPFAEAGTATMSGMDIQLILVDGLMYLKMPTSGGKWMKIDLKQLGSMMGDGASDSFSDPGALLDKLSGQVSDANLVGDESVNGTSAKHYRFTVDLTGMTGSTGQSRPSVDDDIWVDEQGRMVKLVTDLGAGKMTMTMSDFGKSVDVKAPPAGQVTDMPNVPGLNAG